MVFKHPHYFMQEKLLLELQVQQKHMMEHHGQVDQVCLLLEVIEVDLILQVIQRQ